MAVTHQSWEWSNINNVDESQNPTRTINGTPMTLTANQPYDIFTGSVGNRTTIPPASRATQFIVLEELGVTPTGGSSLQIVVNTTAYFQNPDGMVSQGVPAKAIPYPCGASPFETGSVGDTGSDISIPSFKLSPAIYIPPGQKWTIQYFTSQGIAGGAENRGGTIGSSVSYMQYDGVDAIIANKLMDMGVPINLNNVDWYRQQALVENLKSLTQTGGVA
tara:strand:+ start:64 stop:720 length:657 start_codon:yes stop_codon:yes gene_type:complete